MPDAQTLKIETNGTVEGTTISIDDEALAGIQELTITIKADPDNTVSATMKYYKKSGAVGPMKLSDVKDELKSPYGAYAVPFTGLTDENELVVFVTP